MFKGNHTLLCCVTLIVLLPGILAADQSENEKPIESVFIDIRLLGDESISKENEELLLHGFADSLEVPQSRIVVLSKSFWQDSVVVALMIHVQLGDQNSAGTIRDKLINKDFRTILVGKINAIHPEGRLDTTFGDMDLSRPQILSPKSHGNKKIFEGNHFLVPAMCLAGGVSILLIIRFAAAIQLSGSQRRLGQQKKNRSEIDTGPETDDFEDGGALELDERQLLPPRDGDMGPGISGDPSYQAEGRREDGVSFDSELV